MKLHKFEGKRVRLIDTEGNMYEGYCGDFIFPEDNEPEGSEAVVLDYPVKNGNQKCDNLIQFNEQEIKSIEIIE